MAAAPKLNGIGQAGNVGAWVQKHREAMAAGRSRRGSPRRRPRLKRVPCCRSLWLGDDVHGPNCACLLAIFLPRTPHLEIEPSCDLAVGQADDEAAKMKNKQKSRSGCRTCKLRRVSAAPFQSIQAPTHTHVARSLRPSVSMESGQPKRSQRSTDQLNS